MCSFRTHSISSRKSIQFFVMEHAKKLMLVEPKLFRPSMREKTLSRLDEEIEKTLQ